MSRVRMATARNSLRYAALAAVAAVATGAGVYAARAVEGYDYKVSQVGRAFNPGTMTVKVGQTIRIVNDDGDLIHHAYVETPDFAYDSGDQEPGAHADIKFPLKGTFRVLCGVHPRMRLDVTVE